MSEQDDFQNEIKQCFLEEAGELLDKVEASLLELEKNPTDRHSFEALLRVMHSLKGGGKAVGFDEISKLGHEAENLLVKVKEGSLKLNSPTVGLLLKCCDCLKRDIAALKENSNATLNYEILYRALEDAGQNNAAEVQAVELEEPQPSVDTEVKQEDVATKVKASSSEEFVRISLKKIDDLLNNFGEQVILQATLEHIKYTLNEKSDLAIKTINQLNKLTYDLQQTSLALRMVSLKQVFSRMERTARDTAVAVSKKIEFISEGQDNELDKTIAEAILDPLTHMIRNAVDHGIESPEERIQAGKNPVGKITLRGFRRGSFFYIAIEDDGKGLDKVKILAKAEKAGLLKGKEKLSDSEIYELIYANGFSTKDAATDLSGRGVGMNVVKDSIQALKGTCHIESKAGQGTLFTIRLPLTLAIFNGIVFRAADSLYVVPNSDVDQVLAYHPENVRQVNAQGERVIDLGKKVIPLVDLTEQMWGRTPKRSDLVSVGSKKKPGTLLISHTAESRFAILVDEVISQQRVVHKTLSPEVKQIRGASGVTILGDGSAALILDIGSYVHKTQGAA